jgi:hypothetical protein
VNEPASRARRVDLAALLALAVSLHFLAAPLRLLGEPSVGARLILIYAVAAPAVGALLALRHRRARFAAYVFLTMDIVRSGVRGAWPFLVADLAVILILQLPAMRRIYPRIDPAQVASRWRRRVGPD